MLSHKRNDSAPLVQHKFTEWRTHGNTQAKLVRAALTRNGRGQKCWPSNKCKSCGLGWQPKGTGWCEREDLLINNTRLREAHLKCTHVNMGELTSHQYGGKITHITGALPCTETGSLGRTDWEGKKLPFMSKSSVNGGSSAVAWAMSQLRACGPGMGKPMRTMTWWLPVSPFWSRRRMKSTSENWKKIHVCRPLSSWGTLITPVYAGGTTQ